MKKTTPPFLFFLTWIVFISSPAFGITITVNSSADTAANDGQCTLREAITSAVLGIPSGGMAGECPGAIGNEDIFFNMGTVTSPIVLGSELPTISVGSVNILGPGADRLTIQGSGAARILSISTFPDGDHTLSGLTFTNGFLPAGQGAVFSIGQDETVTIKDCVFKDNNFGTIGPVVNTSGGAIQMSGANVTILNSTFSNNHAGLNGGAIFVNGFSDSAVLVIKNSTFSGNTTLANGGAIHGSGEFSSISLLNNTFTDNQANLVDGVFAGGALYDDNDGGSITVQNSILFNNTSGTGLTPDNCNSNGGTGISSTGNNIESESDCGFTAAGDKQNTDPLLAPLADNGGPSFTRSLQPGSPALDAGNDAACLDAGINGVDQRGKTRCVDADGNGSTVDIGAYEVQTFTVDTLANDPDASVGDGLCDDGAGNCSLLAAIQESNNLPGMETATFGVTGTITIGSPLIVTDALAIFGPGASSLAVDAANIQKVFIFDSPSDDQSFSLSGVTVTRGNSTSDGGGIQLGAGDALQVNACEISNNQSLTDGGGIALFPGSNLVLRNSTVSDNRTIGTNTNGGGIRLIGNASATLVNSTISGNQATGSGGGLAVSATGTVGLFNVTIFNNAADSEPDTTGVGGGIASIGGPVSFKNSILAGNSDNGTGPDCVATLNSGDFNLIQNTTGCTINGTTSNNVTGQDPLLGLLTNNGGTTLTHALLLNSPAIDKGDTGGCKDENGNNLITDQRGFNRSVNGRCDIGSLENGTCGDGAMDPGEACDDGNTVNDDGCSSSCQIESAPPPPPPPTLQPPAPPANPPGNGAGPGNPAGSSGGCSLHGLSSDPSSRLLWGGVLAAWSLLGVGRWFYRAKLTKTPNLLD